LDNADSGWSSLSGVNAHFQMGNTWNRTSFVVQNQTVVNDMKVSRDKVITTPVTQVSHDTDFHIISSLDGRLTDNVPIWPPDSEKSVSGTMGTTFFSDKLYLNLDGAYHSMWMEIIIWELDLAERFPLVNN
jgi:hypothetical protein